MRRDNPVSLLRRCKAGCREHARDLILLVDKSSGTCGMKVVYFHDSTKMNKQFAVSAHADSIG